MTVVERRPVGRLIVHRGFLASSGPAAAATRLETWGLPDWDRDRDALLLGAAVRRHEHDLTATELRGLLVDGSSALGELLPTVAAAVTLPSGATRVATDYLGFRHVFHGRQDGTGVVSTSSSACALALGAGLDLEAVAVQSSLGWQLGQRTLFTGVQKLAPAGVASLAPDGRVDLSTYLDTRPTRVDPLELDRAVRQASELLRGYLTAYLEEHPGAGLQLTGGQDSRLLLSAIPVARRRGLRVVTLGTAGEPDVDIAAALAARYGMRHELLSLAGLDELDPAAAHQLCLDAARRLDFSADPVAHAALTCAEARSEPGPRLSGLGGEVARGFYYLGPPTTAPVSRRRAERLAHWRMFVNEGVPAQALRPEFAEWARGFATEEVVRVLAETGRPWMAATDELYLGHRMQRWGGVTETAVCLDREIVNPMLDDRFIAIATALAPLDKRNSRFLSRLQLALDPELGSIPLDGRPAPAAYARRSVQNSARQTAATGRKAARKVGQRLRGENRPPAGGELLAAKVVEHWRSDPSVLAPLGRVEVFRQGWLESLLAGEHQPPTSAVALMVNLLAASDR